MDYYRNNPQLDFTYSDYQVIAEEALVYTGRYNKQESKEIIELVKKQAYENGVYDNTIIDVNAFNRMNVPSVLK